MWQLWTVTDLGVLRLKQVGKLCLCTSVHLLFWLEVGLALLGRIRSFIVRVNVRLAIICHWVSADGTWLVSCDCMCQIFTSCKYFGNFIELLLQSYWCKRYPYVRGLLQLDKYYVMRMCPMESKQEVSVQSIILICIYHMSKEQLLWIRQP